MVSPNGFIWSNCFRNNTGILGFNEKSSIVIEVTKNNVRFNIDKIFEEVLFIDSSKKIRMCVNLNSNGDSVELIEMKLF